MKKSMALFMLVICMLFTFALADVEIIGNSVNLREGPGINHKVSVTVKSDAELIDLDCISTDDRGVDWYWVQYEDKKLWISSRYANLVDIESDASDEYYEEQANMRFGNARLISCIPEDDHFIIEIRAFFLVGPDDIELIELYGLEEGLDGYDYEIVYTKEDPENYEVQKTGVEFTILGEDMVLPITTDWQGFAVRLVERCIDDDSYYGVPIQFRTDDAFEDTSRIAEIGELYIP